MPSEATSATVPSGVRAPSAACRLLQLGDTPDYIAARLPCGGIWLSSTSCVHRTAFLHARSKARASQRACAGTSPEHGGCVGLGVAQCSVVWCSVMRMRRYLLAAAQLCFLLMDRQRAAPSPACPRRLHRVVRPDCAHFLNAIPTAGPQCPPQEGGGGMRVCMHGSQALSPSPLDALGAQGWQPNQRSLSASLTPTTPVPILAVQHRAMCGLRLLQGGVLSDGQVDRGGVTYLPMQAGVNGKR
ncbi:hypothetical protein K431DRAFT_103498 [Polychaeton citri CBS 116435]|uniref:Uncharacterized protein n=1 Tax=Polychaeton citri CBS 116435 TaxID=1314669 RepID=A0A9P4Q8D9_9PEZI|nr:hypothetical protein K431DRAFT_103498 [Polychaeton citri CBS 116435]